MGVSISKGNTKMGGIWSVSLPSIKTCRNDCECNERCYASKLERLRPNVRDAYQNNLDVLTNEPDTYWRQVEAAIMLSRFFRFHVSGDIPDLEYLGGMVRAADKNPHCEILCFTKKYELVNLWLRVARGFNTWLPENLHIILSAWRGLEMKNPYNLPEAHVRYRDGTTTAGLDAVECGGNCTECAMTGAGCWKLENGEQVVFNEH